MYEVVYDDVHVGAGGDRMSLQDEWTWDSQIVTWNDLNVSWNGFAAVVPANSLELAAGYTSIYRR